MAEDLVEFVGRTVELAVLRRLRAEAEEGRPQTVLVTGPAGIGKTSLIEQLLSEVDDTAVLRASGEPWEAFVAFGVIDQLVRAAGVRGGLLLASRQRALPAEEPVGVGAVLLESLERLERKSAVSHPAGRRRPLGGCRLTPRDADRSTAARPHWRQPAVREGPVVRAPG